MRYYIIPNWSNIFRTTILKSFNIYNRIQWLLFRRSEPSGNRRKRAYTRVVKEKQVFCVEAMVLQILEVEDTLCIAESENVRKKQTWELGFRWFQWRNLVEANYKGFQSVVAFWCGSAEICFSVWYCHTDRFVLNKYELVQVLNKSNANNILFWTLSQILIFFLV